MNVFFQSNVICQGSNLALSLNEYEIDYETAVLYAVLYVPSASVAAYADSDWAKYFKNIVGMKAVKGVSSFEHPSNGDTPLLYPS